MDNYKEFEVDGYSIKFLDKYEISEILDEITEKEKS